MDLNSKYGKEQQTQMQTQMQTQAAPAYSGEDVEAPLNETSRDQADLGIN